MTNSSKVNAGKVSVVIVSVATTLVAHNRSTFVLTPAEKPAKFSRVNFKRCHQKTFFYITMLSLQRFINENVLVMSDETAPEKRFLVIKAWTH